MRFASFTDYGLRVLVGLADALHGSRSFGQIAVVVALRNPGRRSALVECCQTDGGRCVLMLRSGLKPSLSADHGAILNKLDRSAAGNVAYPCDAAAA